MPHLFPRLFRLLAALALAAPAACQSGGESPPIHEGARVCADCSLRAGGETSDFGHAIDSGCKPGPERALTEDEVGSYDVERTLTLLREGVTSRLGWLSDRRGVTSRTPESLITLRFHLMGEPRLGELQCRSSVERSVRVDASVDVTTSDGSLLATVRGRLNRAEGAPLWRGSFGADLASATGSVDLALRKAWSEVRGEGAREGELLLNLELGDSGIRGQIEAAVGYPRKVDDGIASIPPLVPRVTAPVVGHFPLTHCSAMRGVPVDGDEPLTEAGGRTARMLLAEANRVLERCSKRWDAVYRDGSATEVRLTFTESADLAFCSGRDGWHWVSWALTGSLTSADGQLRSDITFGRAWTQPSPVEEVELASEPLFGEPIAGVARCWLDPEQPDGAGTWDGYVQRPGQAARRACLSFPNDAGSCALD